MKEIVSTSNMIFVFGSNLSGIHGAGAARYAAVHKGAVYGIGEGLTGSCYALPTKGKHISFMSLDEVNQHTAKFLKYAYDNQHLEFQVTQVGCGLGGFTREDIAPMFEYAGENCYFDTMWGAFLPTSSKFWGTF